ncbi:hypothetical protein E4U43_004148 [Claviceps pusilla]|uniref:HhH-GPD domain-containing protein n=1 Tax=Claviceps pusilla TaxID=123648 RepID=A0A9P7NH50_9HYPO|nr:hypothetical protein E4U43_004148 [Claviceps pusilla]
MAATRRSSRLSTRAALRLSSTATISSSKGVPKGIQSNRKRRPSTTGAPSPSSHDTAEQQQQTTTPKKRRTQQITADGDPALSTMTFTPIKTENVMSPLPARGTKPRDARVARLADPMATNAALLSPESSGVVASKKVKVEPVSPDHTPTARRRRGGEEEGGGGGGGGGGGTLTTENLLDKACAHLISVDERMRPLVERNYCKMFSPEGLAEKIDPFKSLASGIISQQLSGAAARSIKTKFLAMFDYPDDDDDDDEDDGPRFPHPSQVAACSIEKLRTAGLSQRKAEYIKGLAGKFTSGELSAQMLLEAPYEELVEKLTAVRGLGKWSVEMFACFGLKRMDVFSVGDLGVQRGMAAFVGRDVAKLKHKAGKWKYISEQEMLEISAKFAPYRSLFMWLMWRVEESFKDVSILE